jgi:hypothetical protein
MLFSKYIIKIPLLTIKKALCELFLSTHISSALIPPLYSYFYKINGLKMSEISTKFN